MKNLSFIFNYLKTYVAPVAVSIFFSLFSVMFSVFSLTMLIPFLSLLFDKLEKVTHAVPFAFNSTAILNNVEYLMTKVIDEQGKTTALLYISIMAFLMFFTKNLFLYLSNFILAPVRNGVLRNIRNDIYLKLLVLPLGFYRHNKKGDIISRITNDVQDLDESMLKPLQTLFLQFITVTFYITALFVINYKLTFFVIVLLPIAALVIVSVSKKLKRMAPELQQRTGSLLSTVEETLSGLRVIKAFNAIDFSDKRFRESNNTYTRLKNSIYRRVDMASPMSEFLGTTFVIIILIYGGSLILGGKSDLNAATFITYLTLFTQIINPAKDLTSSYYSIQKGKAAIDRIKFIMDAEEVVVQKENALHLTEFKEQIEYKNLTFAYDKDNTVLDSINLLIPKGKSIAIVGPSGAGKSTMVDLIPRFYDCTAGALLIDGIPITDYVIDDVRALTGIVSQDTILFNDTIFNNIAFGVENVTEDDVINAAKIANAHQFIVDMQDGYNTNIGDRGGKLSGGQRQRISIARAVLKNPPILILDEATSALDTESEHLVQEALDKLMKGRTTIAIAHRLSTIKNMDEIIVLEKGTIVERGDHQTLISKNGIYKKLQDLQSFN